MVRSLGKKKNDLVIAGPYEPIIPVIEGMERIRLLAVLSEILMPGELDGGIKVTGDIEYLPEMIEEWNIYTVITLMLGSDKNLRRKFWKKINEIEDKISSKLITMIHPNTIISKSTVGAGSIIFPFNVISGSILKEGCIIKPGCYIGEGVEIEKYCVIESGVSIGPNTTIGSGSYIGANSSIVSNVKISGFVDIKPNTFVSKNIKNDREI